MTEPTANRAVEPQVDRPAVDETLRDYLGHFEPANGVDPRRAHYTTMVNQFYDLVTEFYERGWGKSFHFAPRCKDESFKDSIVRHEHYLALRLELAAASKVLDVGCGVGGPMREIARFTGAAVDGINNNGHQLAKLRQYNREARLAERCRGIKADFMSLPLPDASYDAAYAIESTCHAPDKSKVFGEVLRVLAPGGLFAGYEWCLTDSYDPSSDLDRSLKHRIEVGDGLPDIARIPDVRHALEVAGFEVVEIADLALTGDPETLWYLPLVGEPGISGFTRRGIGRFLTRHAVAALEKVGVAPKGSSEVSRMLNDAADALVEAGERGIFTPMLFFLARKPH
jgi:sterol 24-C-methyltransferase